MINQDTRKALRPMIRSEHWSTLEAYLKEQKEGIICSLLKCQPEEVAKLQGRAQELDTLLRLKPDLIAEETPKKT